MFYQLHIGNQSMIQFFTVHFSLKLSFKTIISKRNFPLNIFRPNGSLVAILGDYDIFNDTESKKSVARRVKQIIYHPDFNNHTFDNDLALLKLAKPVQYDTHIGKT